MIRTISAKSRIAVAAATVVAVGAAGTTAALSQVSPARAKLVPLQNRFQAETIIRLFGHQALWAYDPATGRYRSVVNWSPPAGSTLYTPASRAWALHGRLNGLGAAVRSVGTSAASTAVAAYRLDHRHKGSGTVAQAPESGGQSNVPVTSSVPATSDPASNGPVTTQPPTTQPPTTQPPTTQPATTQPPTTQPPAAAGSPTGGTGGTGTTAASNPLPTSGAAGPWSLVFDSEFNGSGLNASKWTPYWFSNGSSSNGTTMLSSNVSESGGSLNLALNGSTGGLVSTNGKFQFTYGYVEARIWLPASGSSIANWPAFWTDGQSWPTDGEMDVLEGLGGSACWHFHDPSGGPGGCAGGTFSGGWHTFGADWEPGSVTYYYDGVKVGTISSGITSSPMYLILENSGGSYGGPSVNPSTMKVDYVRVWQHG